MTPNGRAHLRNIRIVAADREGPNGPEWQFVRARKRLKGFCHCADNSTLTRQLLCGH
jgi:hypothetical protein